MSNTGRPSLNRHFDCKLSDRERTFDCFFSRFADSLSRFAFRHCGDLKPATWRPLFQHHFIVRHMIASCY